MADMIMISRLDFQGMIRQRQDKHDTHLNISLSVQHAPTVDFSTPRSLKHFLGPIQLQPTFISTFSLDRDTKLKSVITIFFSLQRPRNASSLSKSCPGKHIRNQKSLNHHLFANQPLLVSPQDFNITSRHIKRQQLTNDFLLSQI